MTVTGIIRFSSSKTWVMPSLRPRIPLLRHRIPSSYVVLRRASVRHANAPHGQETPAERWFGCAARFPAELGAGPARASVDQCWMGSSGGMPPPGELENDSDPENPPPPGSRRRIAHRRRRRFDCSSRCLERDTSSGRRSRLRRSGRSARSAPVRAAGLDHPGVRGPVELVVLDEPRQREPGVEHGLDDLAEAVVPLVAHRLGERLRRRCT